MRCTVYFGTLLIAAIITEASVYSEAVAGNGGAEDPTIREGVIGVHLRERGALLIENFKGDTVDEEKWPFPVGAMVRVSCDGTPLGEAEIQLNELDGLYPDDVYDIFME